MQAPLAVYVPPTPQQQAAQANACAYAALQQAGTQRIPAQHRAPLRPTMQQPMRTQAPEGWGRFFGLQGVEGAHLPSAPPATLKDLVDENRRGFVIRMGAGADLAESLQGHVIAVGIDGMGRAHRIKSLIALLDFERNDLVLVAGTQTYCDDWAASHGVPTSHCMALDPDNPELAQRLIQSEQALLDEILSTAQFIHDHLPDSYFDRYGYRLALDGLHAEQLLEFIGQARNSVTPDVREAARQKVDAMESAGKRYSALRQAVASMRHAHQARMAAFHKSSDRIVLMVLDPENVIALAPALYRQNDIAMIDRMAIRTSTLPPPAAPIQRPEL